MFNTNMNTTMSYDDIEEIEYFEYSTVNAETPEQRMIRELREELAAKDAELAAKDVELVAMILLTIKQ